MYVFQYITHVHFYKIKEKYVDANYVCICLSAYMYESDVEWNNQNGLVKLKYHFLYNKLNNHTYCSLWCYFLLLELNKVYFCFPQSSMIKLYNVSFCLHLMLLLLLCYFFPTEIR